MPRCRLSRFRAVGGMTEGSGYARDLTGAVMLSACHDRGLACRAVKLADSPGEAARFGRVESALKRLNMDRWLSSGALTR